MRNRDFQPESNIAEGGCWFFFFRFKRGECLSFGFSTHELRQTHQSLDEAQRDETVELARHSRLLLEKKYPRRLK